MTKIPNVLRPGRLHRRAAPATVLVAMAVHLAAVVPATSRETQSFDADWRFLRGNAPGAEESAFNDSEWRQLDVPHDWSIEGPFARTNRTRGAGAWAPSGVAWYRKAFALPAEDAARRVFIEFDGVMQNSEVWINGVSLGQRPNGYVSFGYELTPHLRFGEGRTNVVAVRVDTSAQPASRWYTGAGIYRHVRLTVTDPVHFEPHATFVTTPDVRPDGAGVRVTTRVINQSTTDRIITLQVSVHGPPGSAPDGAYAVAGSSPEIPVAAGGAADLAVDVEIPWAPRRWSPDHPELHQAHVRIRADGETLDEEHVPFGVRDFEFKADSGFWLNGDNVRLYGVCLHHDGSAFGAAVPLAVWQRRLERLRTLGVNAIRTAHNPADPAFLDLCDRMGFLVMEEFFDCWTQGKNTYDYHLHFDEWSGRDLEDTVRRDRNHPCIVLWSIGNEIRDTRQPDTALPIAQRLVQTCHTNDPTRPVTQGLFRPNRSGDYTNGLADTLDVVGTNYRDDELLAAQRARPDFKIIGTEQRHDRETWLWLRDHPSHAGQFLWVGVDYLGETRSWPRIAYPGGLLDRTAAIKPMAWERQSWWSDTPMVRMVRRVAPSDVLPEDPGYSGEERHTQVQYADWTPRDLTTHDETVEVYSNGQDVELSLNGQSLGSQPIHPDASPRVWTVPFQPGTLQAVARNQGQDMAQNTLRTAGPPARIELSVWGQTLAGDWDNLCFVTATIVDEHGVVVPRANHVISFHLRGPGRIVAVDNANNTSIEPFHSVQRRAYQGRCEAAVRADTDGRITISAVADGLRGTESTIQTE